MNTTHAAERISTRLSPAESDSLAAAIVRMAGTMPDSRSYAVRVWSAPESRGTFTIGPDGTGDSNGTELFAVIRNRTLVTVMWRRKAQPVTPEAFRVDVTGKATWLR